MFLDTPKFADRSKARMNLEKKIEALLFWKAEPMSVEKLATGLKVSEADVETALASLKSNLDGRGIILMRKGSEAMLATAPDVSALIEQLTKEELNKDLGKAALETLSIVLYFGPITRSEIDYIRGVNSTFVLRSLMIRGLIERVQNKDDQRSFHYKPTFELLSFLGIADLKDLPEYETVQADLANFKKAQASQDAAYE